MTSKYFNSNLFSLVNELRNQVELPHDFLEFFKCNAGDLSIYSFKPKELESIGLAIKREDQVYIFDGLLSFEELQPEIKFNWQSTGLLKFANNGINEGGYYIGIKESNIGKIYFYENYVEWATDEEIILLSNSFREFIEKLEPVGLIYHDSSIEYKFLDEKLDSDGKLIGLNIKPIV